MIKTNIVIKVRCDTQFIQIQKICFDNGVFWKSGECYKTLENMGNFFKWVCIRDFITYGVYGEYWPEDLKQVDPELFIRTNGTFDIRFLSS